MKQVYGQAWPVLARLPILGAPRQEEDQHVPGPAVTKVNFRALFFFLIKKKPKTQNKREANSGFRSDLGTKMLNFIPVSESVAPKVVCTPGDQTPFKFSVLVINSILLLF